jgi:hypothetical protein
MSDGKPKAEVTSTVERHGRDMKKVNDKLRDLISTLQTHKERFAGAHPDGAPTLTPPPAPTQDAGVVVLDKRRLEAELALAREQLGRATAERGLLRERLAEVEVEHRRVCDQFVEAEEQTSELVQQFATLQQIHGAAGAEELLQVLQEVVINVIGSEQLAIYELRGGELRLARAFGLDHDPAERIAAGQGLLGGVAATGRLRLGGRGDAPGDDRLTACVPLTAGATVVGVLAIYRLLGHKPRLGPADLAVFDLLTPHAGQALRLRRLAGRPA